MAANPTITELDSAQIIQRCYDGANDSLRMEIGSDSGIEISLNPTSDGVSTYAGSIYANATATTSSTGQIIAAMPCVGIKNFQLYISSTTAVSETLTVRIDISPAKTGAVFFQTSTTLSLTASTLGAVIASPVLTALGGQVQVTITANSMSGVETAQVYLVGTS